MIHLTTASPVKLLTTVWQKWADLAAKRRNKEKNWIVPKYQVHNLKNHLDLK